jgi:hypothetical protein
MAQDGDMSLLGRIPFAAATPFEELRPRIFGHDALDLQQQLIFRGLCERAIEEDDLHPGARQLLPHHDLVGVVACEAVGAMDLEAIHRRGDIA